MNFKLIKTEAAYSGFFKILKHTVSHDLYKGGTSEPYVREIFERGCSAAVFMYDPERESVVLIEQFRVGAIESDNPWVIEMVAGMIELGEIDEDVAVREALEETGAELGALELISNHYNSVGGSSEMTTIYSAIVDSSKISGIHGLDDENEDIKVRKMSYSEFFKNLESNCFKSAQLVLAGYWFKTKIDCGMR